MLEKQGLRGAAAGRAGWRSSWLGWKFLRINFFSFFLLYRFVCEVLLMMVTWMITAMMLRNNSGFFLLFLLHFFSLLGLCCVQNLRSSQDNQSVPWECECPLSECPVRVGLSPCLRAEWPRCCSPHLLYMAFQRREGVFGGGEGGGVPQQLLPQPFTHSLALHILTPHVEGNSNDRKPPP